MTRFLRAFLLVVIAAALAAAFSVGMFPAFAWLVWLMLALVGLTLLVAVAYERLARTTVDGPFEPEAEIVMPSVVPCPYDHDKDWFVDDFDWKWAS